MALPWRPRGLVADALVALAVAAIFVLYLLVSRADLAPMWPFGHVLLVLAAAALLLRRWQPVPVLLAEMALTWLYFANGYPEMPIYVACIVALYTVADRAHPLIALACGAVAIAGAAWQEITTAMPPGDLVMITGWLLMVIAFGAAARSRRAYLAAAERRAVIEERLRIARDVHDAVGHAMSLINVQAGAALHRFADRPDKAEEALATIKQASAQALRELRATVGELRHDPGAEGIGRLVDNARRAGLDVRFTAPEGVRLGPEADLAAYRIVQEALTNAARHAGATRVWVELTVAGGELTIIVQDDGAEATAAPESLPTGLGLAPRPGKLSAVSSEPPLNGPSAVPAGSLPGDLSAVSSELLPDGPSAALARPLPGDLSGGSSGPSPDGSSAASRSGDLSAVPLEPPPNGPSATSASPLPGEPSGVHAESSGSGLTGMAERVARLGGTLQYGPHNGKGFRVLARLPADRGR
ncbi:hypothetical protein GCM10022419_031100 [Nonomuraea rosea]|uniref:histidine kinase n=1 Tax=Nonomuraea rosea TaxID=638574 RepID=A0ABP6WC59_9ACTN